MADSIGGEDGGGTRRKADVVADAINRFLQELSIKCAKEEGVRDYFHVGVIGYGGSSWSVFRGFALRASPCSNQRSGYVAGADRGEDQES